MADMFMGGPGGSPWSRSAFNLSGGPFDTSPTMTGAALSPGIGLGIGAAASALGGFGGGLGGDLAMRATLDTSQARAGMAHLHRDYERLLWTFGGMGRRAGVAFGGAMSGYASVAVAAMGASFAGFAFNAASSFLEVERQWADVTSLMVGMTDEATDTMFQSLRDFNVRAGFQIQDTMKAAYQAVSAGVAPEDTEAFLGVAGRAARAGVSDLTTAVDLLAGSLNAYGQEITEATRFSDVFFTTVKFGVTTFNELASALPKLTAMAAQFGVTIEDIGAATATLTRTGLTASQSTTRLMRALTELSRQEGKAGEFFKEAAGVTFPEFIDSGKTLLDVFQLLGTEAEKQGKELTDVFGRVEGGQAAIILSTERFANEYINYMENITGSTEAAYQKHEDATYLATQRIGALWTEAKLAIGEDLIDLTDLGLRQMGLVETHAQRVAQSVLSVTALLNADLDTLTVASDAYRRWVDAGGDPNKFPQIVGEGGQPLTGGVVPTRDAIEELTRSSDAGVRNAALTVLNYLDSLIATSPASADRFSFPNPTRAGQFLEETLYGGVGTGFDITAEQVNQYVTAAMRSAAQDPASLAYLQGVFGETDYAAMSKAEADKLIRDMTNTPAWQDWIKSREESSRATRKNTEEMTKLREAIEEQLEEAKKWQVHPGAEPILPEHILARDPRFNSRRVINALSGGIL